MAKFNFGMQSILNLRERLEEQKEQEFAKALQILTAAKQLMENLNQQKSGAILKLKDEIGIQIKPIDFQQYSNYIEVIKQKIENQKEAIVQAEKFVEKKRLELIESTKERKMMEELKENEFEEYIEEGKKTEQKQVDEIVSYRFRPIAK